MQSVNYLILITLNQVESFLLVLFNLNRQHKTTRKKPRTVFIENIHMRHYTYMTYKNICVQTSRLRQGIFYSLPSHPSSSECAKDVLLWLGGSWFIPCVNIMPLDIWLHQSFLCMKLSQWLPLLYQTNKYL